MYIPDEKWDRYISDCCTILDLLEVSRPPDPVSPNGKWFKELTEFFHSLINLEDAPIPRKKKKKKKSTSRSKSP